MIEVSDVFEFQLSCISLVREFRIRFRIRLNGFALSDPKNYFPIQSRFSNHVFRNNDVLRHLNLNYNWVFSKNSETSLKWQLNGERVLSRIKFSDSDRGRMEIPVKYATQNIKLCKIAAGTWDLASMGYNIIDGLSCRNIKYCFFSVLLCQYIQSKTKTCFIDRLFPGMCQRALHSIYFWFGSHRSFSFIN